jgi:Tfp pilus assembly protein PilE
MEQSNLVELARRGEPDAIAILMNAVLGPKGITARASLDRDCLNVLLESPKRLNQDTITNFIQKGLLELEILSIHKVRASGKKLTEDRIAWTKEFSIAPQFSERVFSFVQDDYPVPVIEAAPRDEAEAPTPLEPESPVLVEEPEEVLELSLPEHLILDETPQAVEAEIEIPEHFLLSEEEELSAEPEFAVAVAVQEKVEAEVEAEVEADEAIEEEFRLSGLHWVSFYSRTYALPIVLVGVGSFFAGGTAAFFTTSQARTSEPNPALEAQNYTPDVKQEEAEKYIKAMNAAQEKFYKQNNRFANSLEELERSANLISQSYSYAYRLKVSDRSIISASPREAGLKSYSGAVFVSQSGSTTILICQTKKPSMEAPMTPEFSNGKASCDPRSAKLPI